MTGADHPESGRTATRLITGACVWTAVLALFWWDRAQPLVSLVMLWLLALAAVWEAHGLAKRIQPVPVLANVLSAALLMAWTGLMFTAAHMHVSGEWREAQASNAGWVLPVVIYWGLRLLTAPGLSLFAALPICGAMLCMAEIRWIDSGGGQGWAWLVWLVAVSKLGDTAAYFVGRSVGGPKLAPVISPNKTWSGAVASAVAALGLGLALGDALTIEAGAPMLLLLALVVNVAGQMGDLLVSRLKRLANAKDSGSLLPVIGGILDLVDSLLLAAPALALGLWLLGVR